jgi:hypothetical protein
LTTRRFWFYAEVVHKISSARSVSRAGAPFSFPDVCASCRPTLQRPTDLFGYLSNSFFGAYEFFDCALDPFDLGLTWLDVFPLDVAEARSPKATVSANKMPDKTGPLSLAFEFNPNHGSRTSYRRIIFDARSNCETIGVG